jgi:heme exporter protein B
MPIMLSVLRKIYWILCKEMKSEYRSREAIGALLLFSLTTLSVVSMTIGNEHLSPSFLAVLFWIILFFSAMAGLSRVFLQEQSSGTIYTLRLYGGAQPVLFGKFLYNFLLLNLLSLFLLPLFLVFLNVEIYHPSLLLLIILAGNTGMAMITTLLASLLVQAQGQGALFTIVSFPILLPILLFCIKLTTVVFLPDAVDTLQPLAFLGVYDLVMMGISSILFDYIWCD